MFLPVAFADIHSLAVQQCSWAPRAQRQCQFLVITLSVQLQIFLLIFLRYDYQQGLPHSTVAFSMGLCS